MIRRLLVRAALRLGDRDLSRALVLGRMLIADEALQDLVALVRRADVRVCLVSRAVALAIDEQDFSGRIRVVPVDDYRVDLIFNADEGVRRGA